MPSSSFKVSRTDCSSMGKGGSGSLKEDICPLPKGRQQQQKKLINPTVCERPEAAGTALADMRLRVKKMRKFSES